MPESKNVDLRTLVERIRSDDSISVVYKAVQRFNALTGQSFDFWQEDSIVAWWTANQAKFQ